MTTQPPSDFRRGTEFPRLAEFTTSERKPQILLLAGSGEYPSRIMASLDFLADLLRASGAITYLWDLHCDPLPTFQASYYPNPYSNPSEIVKRFVRLAEEVDAFVWASPVYHNSYSGILKNALDTLTIHQCRYKPVALVSCGNGDRTGSQPCDHLRIVARGLLAVPIPTQLIALPGEFVRAKDRYTLVNEALQMRGLRLTQELLAFTTSLHSLRTYSFDGEVYQRNGRQGEQKKTIQETAFDLLDQSLGQSLV
jgi:azobenzene reductase